MSRFRFEEILRYAKYITQTLTKVGLSSPKKMRLICFNKSSLEMMEDERCFLLDLKTSFRSQDI